MSDDALREAARHAIHDAIFEGGGWADDAADAVLAVLRARDVLREPGDAETGPEMDVDPREVNLPAWGNPDVQKVYHILCNLGAPPVLADGEQHWEGWAARNIVAALREPGDAERVNDAKPFRMRYRNWRGETSERVIIPLSVRFGATEWHPQPQWLLLAHDLDKGEDREFAMKDMEP